MVAEASAPNSAAIRNGPHCLEGSRSRLGPKGPAGARNASLGRYVQEILARVYVMAGQPEKAVDALRVVLSGPSIPSRERLRIDPHFAPLRGLPSFQRLVEWKS